MSRAGQQPAARKRVAMEAATAGAIVALLTVIQTSARNVFPFGEKSNQLGDLGGQFVPFLSMFRDILVGHSGLSSLEWTWTVGGGVPSLGIYSTYFSNPLFAAVALFPADSVELAMWVITTSLYVLAAVSMVIVLRKLAPAGHSLALVVLAVSYALCGWAVADAEYIPMWLAGYVGLPLFIVIGLWCLEGRRFVASVLIITLVWWSNYYTAYMASLGAVLIFSLYTIAIGRSVGELFRSLMRFLVRGVLGVALTAVILLPTYMQVRQAADQPGDVLVHQSPLKVLPHFVGGSFGPGVGPSLFVGAFTLFLALCLLVEGGYAKRARITWGIGLVLTLASFMFAPTLLMWNVFESPNGNPFRAIFVLSALLVVMAWLAVQKLDSASVGSMAWIVLVFALIVGSVLWAMKADYIRSFQWFGIVLFLLIPVVVVVHAKFVLAGNVKKMTAGLLLALALTDVATNAAWTNEGKRAIIGVTEVRFNASEPVQSAQEIADLGWPTYRVNVKEFEKREVLNSGAYLGLPDMSYYSSILPDAYKNVMKSELGLGSGDRPRLIYQARADAIPHIIGSARDFYKAGDVAGTMSVLPMVREVVPFTSSNPRIPTVFNNRNEVIGSPIYVNPLSYEGGTWDAKMKENGQRIVKPKQVITDRVTCPAGTRLALDSVDFSGSIGHDSSQASISHGTWLSDSVSDGSESVVTLIPRSTKFGSSLGDVRYACAKVELATQKAGESQVPDIRIAPSHVSANFGRAVDTAAIATSAIDGWTCQAGGRPATTSNLHGLLTVDMNDSDRFTCDYRTPGLLLGGLISVGALVITVLLAVFLRRVQRAGAMRNSRPRHPELDLV